MANQSVDHRDWFLYTSGVQVPQHVRYVRIDPTAVKQIPDGAFAFCQRLFEVQVVEQDSSKILVWIVIGRRAFHQCIQLRYISIPSCTEEIGDRAFEECRSLQVCTLPDQLKWIGKRAFRRCESLKDITIPPLISEISALAFQFCMRLRSLTLPVGLKVVREHAFHGCVLLENLEIPNTVVEIGESAFERCKSIARIRIPPSTKRIGDSAFAECSRLKTVEMPGSHYGGLWISIRNTFAHCTDLRNIVIQPSLDLVRTSKKEPTTRFKGCVLFRKAMESFMSIGTVMVDDILANRFGSEEQEGDDDLFQMHKLCYYQSHYSTTEMVQKIEEMVQAIRERNNDSANDILVNMLSRPDSVGMTPMHILVMSSAPRIELLATIVNLVPPSASILIQQKDVWGMTPLDCIKFENELFDFTMGVLRLAIGRRIDFLALEFWQQTIQSLLDEIDPERSVHRRRQIIILFQKLAQLERTEAVCIVEQALWKRTFMEIAPRKRTFMEIAPPHGEEEGVAATGEVGSPEDSLSLRELSRLNCGADIVIANILPFLGEP